jgi:hypothetical protein
VSGQVIKFPRGRLTPPFEAPGAAGGGRLEFSLAPATQIVLPAGHAATLAGAGALVGAALEVAAPTDCRSDVLFDGGVNHGQQVSRLLTILSCGKINEFSAWVRK